MVRAFNFIIVLAVAALFWAVVPLSNLFDAFQPMVVALSVIVAAIFVRLNRGMPTLEWKSLERRKRTILTAKLVDLSKEYVSIVAITGVALIGLVTLIVIGKESIAQLSGNIQKSISAAVGLVFSLCLSRMAYVVWRDSDIMELQKYLIDTSADKEAKKFEIQSADHKLNEISKAGLMKQGYPPTKEL